MPAIPIESPKSRCSDLLGFITQLEIAMFLKPPVDSAPVFIALQKLDTTQLLITISSQGARPVLFKQTASSSVSKTEFERINLLQPSISIPSLFLFAWLYTFILLTTTSSQF